LEPQEDHIFCRFIFSRAWQIQSGTRGVPGSRHSSVSTVTVMRERRTRNWVHNLGVSKAILLRSTKSSAIVEFILYCVEREAEGFSPRMQLTGLTWQVTVPFFRGRSVPAIRLLSVVLCIGSIPLYILTLRRVGLIPPLVLLFSLSPTPI